jgi:ribonuclease HI
MSFKEFLVEAKKGNKKEKLKHKTGKGIDRRAVEWHWVRGHDISEGNIEADRLANLGCTVAK